MSVLDYRLLISIPEMFGGAFWSGSLGVRLWLLPMFPYKLVTGGSGAALFFRLPLILTVEG